MSYLLVDVSLKYIELSHNEFYMHILTQDPLGGQYYSHEQFSLHQTSYNYGCKIVVLLQQNFYEYLLLSYYNIKMSM